MKKFKFLSILFLFIFQTISVFASPKSIIRLQKVDPVGGMPLMEALSKRRTDRTFDNKKEIDNKTLSEILWATMGINRSDGRLTIPTAMNKQNMEIYVFKSDGTWLYNNKKNELNRITREDYRKFFGRHDFIADTSITLLYVSKNNEKENYASMHAGSAYQNVGLYCASVGLNNVVRASFSTAEIKNALNMPKDRNIIISQTIGW